MIPHPLGSRFTCVGGICDLSGIGLKCLDGLRGLDQMECFFSDTDQELPVATPAPATHCCNIPAGMLQILACSEEEEQLIWTQLAEFVEKGLASRRSLRLALCLSTWFLSHR